MENGGDLRNYMTQRYASSMVFLSLMLAAELNVLFNSSPITTNIRLSLSEQQHFTLKFWVGFTILVSIILTLLSLIVTFTAWGMVSAISDENAHCILRSSIGQYVGELPQRFVVASIYSFLLWILLFIFVLIPVGFWSILLLFIVLALLAHTITVFSVFGRLILHSTAMSPNRIFEEGYEKALTPQPLQEQLHVKAMAELSNGTSITRQYRRKMKPLDRKYDQEELAAVMRHSWNRPSSTTATTTAATTATQVAEPPTIAPTAPAPLTSNRGRVQSTADGHSGGTRIRADSTVRFADELLSPPPARRGESRATALTPMTEERSRASSRGESPTTTIATNGSLRESVSGGSLKDAATTMLFKDHTNAPGIPPPPADMTPKGISVSSLDDWLAGSTPMSTPGMDDRKRTPFSSALRMPPPHPREVSTRRSNSIISSFDEFDPFPYNNNNNAERALTDDEKFDLDYPDYAEGVLFDNGDTTTNQDARTPHDETQGLLHNGSPPTNNYSSTTRKSDDMV